MTKKGLLKIEMEYQERILYMGLLTIVKMLIEIVPDKDFENVFSDDTRKDVLNLNLLIRQRLDEINNELG